MSKVKRALDRGGAGALALLSIASVILFVSGCLHLFNAEAPSRIFEKRIETASDIEPDLPDGIIGMLHVEGTTIDTAIMQPSGSEPDGWYLDHDAHGRPSKLGNPYLDRRCDPSQSRHLLIYGHRVEDSPMGFSELSRSFEPNGLEDIGTASLTMRDGRKRRFLPIAAMCVDQAYAPIQQFSFEREELPPWLEAMRGDAGCSVGTWKPIPKDMACVLTLVTCSDQTPGRRSRTLTLFVEV